MNILHTCRYTNPGITISCPYRLEGEEPGDEWRVCISTEGNDFGHGLHFATEDDATRFAVWCTNGANTLWALENSGARNVFDLGQALWQRWDETGRHAL